MKRKFTLAFGALLLIAAVSAFVYVKNERNPMDEIFNANVEALATGETDQGVCFNTITTASGRMVLYCGTCTYVPGKPTIFRAVVNVRYKGL